MKHAAPETHNQSSTPGLPALFLFAHHDDEIFICSTMKRLARIGEVSVAWVTSGGLHGARREAESRRAMKLLGVPDDKLYFFRLPDGRALDHAEDIIIRFRKLVREIEPASVFVPAFEGGHPDHDAVQLFAAMAIGRAKAGSADSSKSLRLYEFPLYNRAAARLFSVGEFIPDATPTLRTALRLSDRLLRRKIVSAFPSQHLISWPLFGIKGGPMMLHIRGEPYRRVPPGRDYTFRPHPGRLAYEFYTPVRFKRFAQAAAALRTG